MIKSYKILSLLLSYPNAELQEFLPQAITELQNESLLHPDKLKEIAQFVSHFGKTELIDWQAEYVQLFDYSRSASLHIFEHIKGDAKDRGQAMVDLLEFYNDKGWNLSANELPDYLPALLEFLSLGEIPDAAEILTEPVHVINRIYLVLKEKENPYKHLLSAVISLSAKQPDGKATALLIQNEISTDTDAEYEEKPIDFSGNGSCINCK